MVRGIALLVCCAPLLMGASLSLTYEYDDAGRLTRVDYGDGRALLYSYGPQGELLQREVVGDWPTEPTPAPDSDPAPEPGPEPGVTPEDPGDSGGAPDASPEVVAEPTEPDDGGGCGGCQGGRSGGPLAVLLSLIVLALLARRRRAALALLSLSALAVLPVERAAAAPQTVEGRFAVQLRSDGVWQDVATVGFDAMPRTASINLGAWVDTGASVTVRIVQRGGHAAHLDAVTLGGQPARSVDGRQGPRQAKLAAADHDVLHVLGKTLELRFPAQREGALLALTARVEGARVCPRPFVFGPFDYALDANPGRLEIDGELAEIASDPPFFQAWAEAGTGHPSSGVYGWVRNDAETLYVALDFTGDNTVDGDADYAAVTVRVGEREETFEVSGGQRGWGTPGFTYTDRVGYQHKVYELAIPLSRIEQDPFAHGAPLELSFTLYGTCGPEFQDPNGNCCPPEEKDPDGYCIEEPVDPPDTEGPIFKIKNLYGTFHHVVGVNTHEDPYKVHAVGWSSFKEGILSNANQRATLWRAGVTTGLSTERNLGNSDPAENLASRAHDVNESGLVVGWFNIATGDGATRRAFTLTPPPDGLPYEDADQDGMNDHDMHLLDLSLGETISEAAAVNNAGAIVGTFSALSLSGSRGFIVSDGLAGELSPPAGGLSSGASSISDTGIVGGVATVEVAVQKKGQEPEKVPVTRPVLWYQGAPEELAVPCKLCGASVLDVNDDGWAVGHSRVKGYASAYNAIWVPSGAGLSSAAYTFGIGPSASAAVRTIGINNKGQVVGGITTENGSRRAFLYLPEADFNGLPAGLHWLDDLIPKISGAGDLVGQSTHELHYAVDINDDGLIIAYGQQRNLDCSQFQCAFYVSMVPTGNDPLPDLPKPLDPFQQTAADFDKSVTHADPVNTWTGELVLEPESELVSGRLSLQRFYSTSVGWRHGYQWSLYQEPVDPAVDDAQDAGAAIVTIVDFQGGRLQFQESSEGWTIADASMEGHQLVETADGFAYLQPDPVRLMRFDAEGRLTEIGDTQGYTQALSYSDGSLATVSDNRGGALTFGYDGEGRLTGVTDHFGRSIGMAWEGGQLTGLTDALGQTTTYQYGPAGGLVAVVRPAGNTPYTQAYTPSGSRVESQTDAYGHTMTFDYASEGLTTLIIDALEEETRHAYTPSGELLVHTDRLGHEASVSYDDEGRLAGEENALSESATLATDAATGHPETVVYADGTELAFTWAARPSTEVPGITHYDLTSRSYPDGSSEQLGYDDAGRLISLTDEAGYETTFTWDAQGQLLTSMNPVGGVTTRTYDDKGRLSAMTTAHGHTVSHAYVDDPVTGQTVETISYSAGGGQRTMTWDAKGQLVSVVDEAGETTSFSYDANGNLTSVTNPLGHTAHYRYDLMDRIEEFEDAAGGVTHMDYDELGRLTAITDPNGVVNTFAYDAEGRLTETTDGEGRIWTRTYDAAGRQVSVVDPLGKALITYAYDATGAISGVTDVFGETMSYTRDALGRILTLTDPRGLTSTTSYAPRGQPASAALPGGLSVGYTWDPLGQLTELEDAAGEKWTHEYDAQGLLTATEDPLGQRKALAYDDFDRVVALTYPDGSVQRTTYDVRGYVTGQSYHGDAEGEAELSHTFEYDAAGQLVGGSGFTLERDPNGAIIGSNGLVLGRDAGGRLTSVTFAPGKTVTYAYVGDKLASVSDWTGQGPVTFSYDAAGREIEIVRPNGVTTAFTYDDGHRVSGIVEARGDTTLASISLIRDAAGATTAATRELPPLAPPPLPQVSLAADAARQIAAFDYDARGRRLSDDRTTYVFDGADQLVGVGEVQLGYDARGRLIERREATGPTETFVWNEGYALPSVSVLREDGEDAVYYVHTPTGELLYSISAIDDAPSYYHCDELGSTTALTNAAGEVTDAWAFGPYGEPLGRTGKSATRFTFHGCLGVMREGDAGLYHMRSRVYDSRTTAFLSRDPVLGVGPITADPYQFARRNPLHYVDPQGEQPYGLKNDTTRHLRDKTVLILVERNQKDGFGELARYYRKELLKRGYGSYFADSLDVALGKFPGKFIRERITGILTIGHSGGAAIAGAFNVTRMENLLAAIARAKGTESANLNALAFWGCNSWHFIESGRHKFYAHLENAAVVGYDTPASASNSGVGRLNDGFASPVSRDPFLDHLEKSTPGEYVISDLAGAATGRLNAGIKHLQKVYEGRASLWPSGECSTGTCTPQ